MKRYTICVDFDGVLRDSNDPVVRPDDPAVPGALSWLFDMIQDFDVVVLTTHAKHRADKKAVRDWIKANSGTGWTGGDGNYIGLIEVQISDRKRPALIYLDDRAVRFTGANFPTKDEIHRLRPWNK